MIEEMKMKKSILSKVESQLESQLHYQLKKWELETICNDYDIINCRNDHGIDIEYRLSVFVDDKLKSGVLTLHFDNNGNYVDDFYWWE